MENVIIEIVESSSNVNKGSFRFAYVKQAIVARKASEGSPSRIESNSKQKVLSGVYEANARAKAKGKRYEDYEYLAAKLATIEGCMSPKSMRTIKRRFKAASMMDIFDALDALDAFEGKTK